MRRQYSETSTRSNFGGVICALGLPFTVIGVILTAVGFTEDSEEKHIWYFRIIGPALLGLAILAFISGCCLRGVIDFRYFCCFPCCRPRKKQQKVGLDDLEELTTFEKIDLIDKVSPARKLS